MNILLSLVAASLLLLAPGLNLEGAEPSPNLRDPAARHPRLCACDLCPGLRRRLPLHFDRGPEG